MPETAGSHFPQIFPGTRLDKVYRNFFVLKRAPADTQKVPKEPKIKEQSDMPLEWLFLLVIDVQKKKKATAIKQTADAFGMAFFVVYRRPKGGKSGRPNKNKQEKEKENKEKKRKKKKKKKEKERKKKEKEKRKKKEKKKKKKQNKKKDKKKEKEKKTKNKKKRKKKGERGRKGSHP